MLGLGEKDEEVLSLLMDLRRNFVDIVTIGQYLSPGPNHLPCLLYTSPSPRDGLLSRMPSSG